jgi:hypothetical protein
MLERAQNADLKLAERLIISSTRLADMAAAITCAVPLYAAVAAFMDAIRSLEGVTANVGDVLPAFADAQLIAESFLLALPTRATTATLQSLRRNIYV